MKLNYFYSFLAAASLMAVTTACSDDDYTLGSTSVTPEQLVQGQAFEVKPDAERPNVIHLTSKMKGMTALWTTPQGRSQSSDYTIDLPFAGDYEVTFGVMTQGGPVYGNPYTFNVPENDFSMLSDAIWTNLAGGVDEDGNNTPKRWVPMDKSYGVGYGSAPVMYLDPDHVNNDGIENKDLMLGSANWTPNWDPGFQSWLIAADDPYMESYMEFGLDAVKGCTLTQMRKSGSGEETVVGTFTLNNSDPKRPTLTFNGGTYAMHNAGMDGVCANYTQDIKIIECTPYVLQLATMRTNSEGPWWLVWNFVAADVQDGTVTIPLGPELVEEAKPEFPVYEDYYKNDILESLLFTVAGNDVTYEASTVTYHLDADMPYDILQWDGTGANKWVAQELYGTVDLPEYSGVDDWTLTLTRSGLKANIVNTTYQGYNGDEFRTSFSAAGGKVHFIDEVTLLESGNAKIAGKDFVVFKCNTDDGLVLGAPYGTDQNGVVNRYIVLNLKPEPVGGAATGPTVIPVDASKVTAIFGDGNADRLRIQLWNSWVGGSDWPIDINAIKLKKKQTLTIQYKINSGITWNAGAAPKTVIIENKIGDTWEDACYDLPHAVAFDTTPGAVQTVKLTNTTDGAVTFVQDCALCIGIQNKGLATVDTNGDNPAVDLEIISITIE
ncbi:MAG: hypothetical protein NC421_02945 [Lachnospiraceae bacterium]|nr:hypothetical protein [Lachnospiraceae bacterium]